MNNFYIIEYLPSVNKKDIRLISKANLDRIKKDIDHKLRVDPVRFGKALKYSLAGLYSLRVGNYRVVYKIIDHVVEIQNIDHRKDAY